MVTCLSSMHSRREDWTLGGDRFISSAKSMLVKTGPFSRVNSDVFIRQTLVPTMSVGMRSGVNWTLPHVQPVTFANTFASRVFPSPG